MVQATSQGSATRKSRFHDEKGNRVPVSRFYELPLAGVFKGTQLLVNRPCLPWVPFAVIRKFKSILNKNSRVLEYGSGRSTIWFARRSYSVTSVESYKPWYDKVSGLFKDYGLKNVDYRFRTGEEYSSALDFASESFDLIIIDGIDRSKCVKNAHGKLKPGGYIYLDNSDTDMNLPDGDMRLAEANLRELADKWSSTIEAYTGFCPGNLHAHEGMLLRKPLPPQQS